jgi:hypothetical protein
VSYQDPQLISRDDLDLSGLRRHVRGDHAHAAAGGIPRANRDLARWHAAQHRRRHLEHIHRGPYTVILDARGRRPVTQEPRPLGWFTGQEPVTRAQADAEARELATRRRHDRDGHGRACHCGQPATRHVSYGSGCGNVCNAHAAAIRLVKRATFRDDGPPLGRDGTIITEETPDAP